MKNDYYVWFDTEYSDLDLKKAVLIQVAAFVTDGSLRRVLSPDRDVRLAIRLSNDAELSDWVQRNLSALIAQCRSADAVDAGEADDRLCAHLAAAVELTGEREDFRPGPGGKQHPCGLVAGLSLSAPVFFPSPLPSFGRNGVQARMETAPSTEQGIR